MINCNLNRCLLLITFLLCTLTLFAQKDKKNDGILNQEPLKHKTELIIPTKFADKNQIDRLAEWLKSPYLNVSVEDATVSDLTLAFNKWLKDHQEEMKWTGREKDNAPIKYMRKLYKMQMDNEFEDVPINMHKRLDAFVEYKKNIPAKPQNFNNADANWQLLGPFSNPEEVPYKEEGYYDEDAGNSGLGRINCIEFSIHDTRNIWVGTSTGGVWKTWDGGRNWINISNSLPIAEISEIAIDQSNSNVIYLAVGDRDGAGGWYGNGIGSRLYKTTDGGINWFRINANFGSGTFIEGLWTHPYRPWEVIVAKRNGMYRSDDGGANWQQTLTTNFASPYNDANNNFFMGVAYANLANPERLFTTQFEVYDINDPSAASYQVRRSDDFGKTWTLMDSVKAVINDPAFLTNYTELAIAPSDANCLYILATEFDTTFNSDRFGAIVRTLDGGKTWETRSRYPSVPNTLGWLQGDSSDIGSQSPYNFEFTINPKNKDNVTVGGVNSWTSLDGGKSFNQTTFWLESMGKSAHADHHWGEYQPISGEYFLATDGGLYKTDNLVPGDNSKISACFDPTSYNYFPVGCYTFPTQWNFVGNGISNNEFYGIAVSKSNPSMVMGGTQDNGTLMRRGGKWYSVFGGDGFVSMIHPTNPNIFYATVYFGITLRTTDGGKNYKYLTQHLDTLDGGEWLTPMEMYEANPNIIIQGRNYNLWRSTNSGDNWSAISDFPVGKLLNRTSAVAMASSNSDLIYVARRTRDASTTPVMNYLWKTTDGGITWKNMWNSALFPAAFITDIAIHPTHPDKIWICFSVGYNAANTNQARKMFYSADGGATWTNITEGLPPFPIWSIAVQNNTEEGIYVGTGTGVFYKDNTKTTFVEWLGGMPRGVPVTDLKIHEGVGKIYAGTYGRGIWSANLYDQPYDNGIVALQKNRSLLLNVYPNPARDVVRIEWDDKIEEGQKLFIFDLHGRVIHTQNQFQNRMSFDMLQNASGIYTVQLRTGKEVITKKFVLVK